MKNLEGPERDGIYDMVYFAIPDRDGPPFGPVLSRATAERQAELMPGYVVGIHISYIEFHADQEKFPDDGGKPA